METTNFGFVASLLFVGVPTIFLIGLFTSTLTLVKVGLVQNAKTFIDAQHFCKRIFMLEKKATI